MLAKVRGEFWEHYSLEWSVVGELAIARVRELKLASMRCFERYNVWGPLYVMVKIRDTSKIQMDAGRYKGG
jgi:hypothetical protein